MSYYIYLESEAIEHHFSQEQLEVFYFAFACDVSSVVADLRKADESSAIGSSS